MMPYIKLSCLLLILVPSVRCVCGNNVAVDVTGFNITDISRNLGSDITYLNISSTNIHTLNLTVTFDYPQMCRLDISGSPVNGIITPSLPHTVALLSLRIFGGDFPIPPDLGDVLEGQMEYLAFSGNDLITIPDNYFENFTALISLSITNNLLSDLNAGNMAGLSHLRNIYLGHNRLNPLPPLHQW